MDQLLRLRSMFNEHSPTKVPRTVVRNLSFESGLIRMLCDVMHCRRKVPRTVILPYRRSLLGVSYIGLAEQLMASAACLIRTAPCYKPPEKDGRGVKGTRSSDRHGDGSIGKYS
jgi:hypothetical protein